MNILEYEHHIQINQIDCCQLVQPHADVDMSQLSVEFKLY
jgi:hypothetical protein